MSDTPKSITTKRGDKGETGLRDGSRVSKIDHRPEALGTVDELNSILGVARAFSDDDEVRSVLLRIQNHLFLAGAEISLPGPSAGERCLRGGALDFLEATEAALEPRLKLAPRFVLYGGCRSSALLDWARAVARRAERAVLRVYAEAPTEGSCLLPYMNRLSDVLYVIARAQDGRCGIAPEHPDYSQGGAQPGPRSGSTS